MKIQDTICRFWVPRMKKLLGIRGRITFNIKAKLFGVKCAGKVDCYGKVHLIRYPGSEISFGKKVQIISSSYRATSTCVFAPAKFQTFMDTAKILVGDGVGLGNASIVARSKTVKIGDNTMIAPNAIIMDSDFHALWPPSGRLTNPAFENDRDVTIGKDVWIGTQVVILKGVTIGDNSIIGARSVVTKDIPANVIAAGSPAKVLRCLKEDDIVE